MKQEFYFSFRQKDGNNPAGITASKKPELPTGDFRITEYTFAPGVTLWFVDSDNFSEDERQSACDDIVNLGEKISLPKRPRHGRK